MKKTIHVLVTLALLAYLILSPEWILNNLNRSIAEENLSKPAPEWHGRIVIWHVAEFRVYQGSMTDYLQARADAYCRRHAGVHIEVVGLTNKKYNDRMARGAFPDAYSFPSGLVYREQLRQIQPQMPEFAGRLDAVRADGAIYAVPYLMSGYLLAGNTSLLTSNGLSFLEDETVDFDACKALLQAALDKQAKTPLVYAPPVLAARMGLSGTFAQAEQFAKGQAALAILDARSLGDVLRSGGYNLSIVAAPVTDYTDQVLYLGASKYADDKQAAVIADFAEFLLSEPEQQRVSSLGALPVIRPETPPVYSEPLLGRFYDAYAAPVVPEPFSYQRHRERLAEEALLALTGESAAIASFFERMQVVENGNI